MIYVIGHERSGNHLTINSILHNSTDGLVLHNIGEWFGPYDQCYDGPVCEIEGEQAPKAIVKSHCDWTRFQYYKPAPVIYVIRDPRDVMVSWWHYLNTDQYYKCNPDVLDFRCKTISEFLRRPLTQFLTHCYGDCYYRAPLNVVGRWWTHVEYWLQERPNVTVVRYEDWLLDPAKNIMRLWLNTPLRFKEQLSIPGLHDMNSVMPRKGIIGDYKNHLSSEDERFIIDTIPTFVRQRLPYSL